MRLTIVFLFVSTSFCAFAAEKAELTINISDCRNTENYTYLSELKVLKNGKAYKILKPEHEHIQVLKGLEFGTYTLVYTSLYKKEESLKIEITENKTYSANVCVNFLDYSKETYKPIIDQLAEDSFYSITILSQGCFHSTENTFKIKRNKNIYTINWGAKSKELSKSDIDAVKHFELELNYMTYEGCTTIDTYIIEYNKTAKRINDGSCRWNGESYLKKQLFGEK